MTGPLLRAERVTYRLRERALTQDVTLTLEAGKLVVVAGPNGAGKSTLLKLLTGELRPSCGRVTMDGEDIETLPAWRLACRRAVMPQAASIAFPYLALEVVMLGAAGVGRALTAARRRAIAREAMETVEVAHLAARDYQTLSGGERQRVQFARALTQMSAGASVETRQLLFLDEPVASLDVKHQLALLEAARGVVRRGAAALVVLHDLNLAFAYADELLVMAQGRCVACGAPRDVVTDALLGEVFGAPLRVGATPPEGMPFVLPHAARLDGGRRPACG
mgnify:CR=1 FL=1